MFTGTVLSNRWMSPGSKSKQKVEAIIEHTNLCPLHWGSAVEWSYTPRMSEASKSKQVTHPEINSFTLTSFTSWDGEYQKPTPLCSQPAHRDWRGINPWGISLPKRNRSPNPKISLLCVCVYMCIISRKKIYLPHLCILYVFHLNSLLSVTASRTALIPLQCSQSLWKDQMLWGHQCSSQSFSLTVSLSLLNMVCNLGKTWYF